MGKKAKKVFALAEVSNPFSTGGGGVNFEHSVQAYFLMSLIIKAYVPILKKPIKNVIFQAKPLFKYNIDDLVVSTYDNPPERLLCQIKHSITISEGNKNFIDVINAAWHDFQRPDFDPQKDRIALVVGCAAKDAIEAVRKIHEQANVAENGEDFFRRINEPRFLGQRVQKYFAAITSIIHKIVAEGENASNHQIWMFFQSFTVLTFDLDYEDGVNQAMIRSLIREHSTPSNNENLVWSELFRYAARLDQSGGTVTLENCDEDIKSLFERDLTVVRENVELFQNTWWEFLVLIGGWNERNYEDINIIEKITDQKYSSLEQFLKEEVVSNNSYISYSHGIWKVRKRNIIFQSVKQHLTDHLIRKCFLVAESVFQQKDNRYTEKGDFSPFIPVGGAFKNSDMLRSGMMQGIYLLCDEKVESPLCTAEEIPLLANGFINNLFSSCTWVRYASLQEFLPTLAEIAPEAYLLNLEKNMDQICEGARCIKESLEQIPFFTADFISGIIWSLETTSWYKEHLIQSIRCLGELSSIREIQASSRKEIIESIKAILYPGYPQTSATPEKQINAVKGLHMESPQVAWEVIKELIPMPEEHTIFRQTQKPKKVTEDKKAKSVSRIKVEKIVNVYATFAIEWAENDPQKLADLAQNVATFDEVTRKSYFSKIEAAASGWSDEQKFLSWDKLMDMKDIFLEERSEKNPGICDPKFIELINSAIEKLTPQDIRVRYRRTFPRRPIITRRALNNLEENRRQSENAKNQAVQELFQTYDVDDVIQFGVAVEQPLEVAYRLGRQCTENQMASIIQHLAQKECNKDFVHGILLGFVDRYGIKKVLPLELSRYDSKFVSELLALILITNDLLSILPTILPNTEYEFWKNVNLPDTKRVESDVDIEFVTDELVKVNRAVAAVNLCGSYFVSQRLPWKKLVDLLEAVAYPDPAVLSTEKLHSQSVINLLQQLQETQRQDERIWRVEFAFLPLLDQYSAVSPRYLVCELANNANLFCDMIKMMFKKRHSNEKPKYRVSEDVGRRLYTIFYVLRIIPGTDWNGEFHENVFCNWVREVKENSKKEDRYEVAMNALGRWLSAAQIEENRTSRNTTILSLLNAADSYEIRNGYQIGLYNQQGVRFNRTGESEKKMAEKYEMLAEKFETLGYSRYAEALKLLGKSYQQDARQIMLEEQQEKEAMTE